MLSAVNAVVIREFIRFGRQKGRLLSTFARPLLWLIVIGSGFERLVPTQGTVSYKQFLLPGIYGMVLLFSTMLSALATVHDREFGPIRMLLVAPASARPDRDREDDQLVLLGTIQAVLLFPLIWILGLRPVGDGGSSSSSARSLLSSVTLSSLGMLIASRLRSIENFAAIMNFVMFPMFFLSSALYPAATLPGVPPAVRPGQPAHLRGRPDAPRAARRPVHGQPRHRLQGHVRHRGAGPHRRSSC